MCPKSLTCKFNLKGVLPEVTTCINGGEFGGNLSLELYLSPAQIDAKGIKCVKLSVFNIGRRKFGYTNPGKVPKYASTELIVSVLDRKPKFSKTFLISFNLYSKLS